MNTKEKAILIYKNINFYNRYEKLSNDYSFENTFENYSNDEVDKIIENLGYKARYDKKENFFGIRECQNNIIFYFNISLKYGLAELILGSRDNSTKDYLVGSVFSGMAKDIEPFIGREREGYIKKPRFRNYEDLRDILKEAFSIYEDFKREVVKEYCVNW